MAEIIPRWEWRAFGDSFGEADARFAALTPEDVVESDETYLLSTSTDENVKVRDSLMDIKALEQVNADGLEQWKPVMKAGFPLPAAQVKDVFHALGLTVGTVERQAYTFEQFLAELVEPDRHLHVVQVHKKRARYKIEGCMAEMTDVVADGTKTRTVALELEDPARVIAAVRNLGLGGYKNISYPRGLKSLVGMES